MAASLSKVRLPNKTYKKYFWWIGRIKSASHRFISLHHHSTSTMDDTVTANTESHRSRGRADKFSITVVSNRFV